MAQLRLFVFGPPRLERDGQAVELGLRRALALLIYLAVTRQPQSRDVLATLLWPEHDQREARANLRRTLHRLSQGLGESLLVTSTETIGIAPEAPLWVDGQQFLQLAGSDERLEEAVALYSDDFLAGFTLPDCPSFDEWQFYERERLRQLLAQSLETLVQRAAARCAWQAAAEHARRWVALDPLHEPAQRALMEAYAQAGQAAAAQRQYQELVRTLDSELGAEPEEATRTLYEAIRARRFSPPAAPPAPADLGAAPGADPAPAELPSAPPLVGRERELDELTRLLGVESGTRLVTLIGPGGAGKTRLAHAVVEQTRAQYEHDAHLVGLTEVGELSGIAPAIAARLGLTGSGELEPRLFGALRERELLLVLDNFEHLLDARTFVSAIIDAAPRVRVLITSRERLGLSSELVYALGGLSVPAEGAGAEALEAEAARLLLQQARLVRPGLDPGTEEVAAIARICWLVQGMPLALTLAASWAELLSFTEIAAEIEHSLDFLATEQHGVLERQRSVRAVFEASWRRLPPPAQQIFAQLTVFRGGFMRQAAEQIAGADLHTLRHLVSSSFVTVNAEAQRYEIHELLRQFAADKHAASPAVAAAGKRHSAYYLDLVRRVSPDLMGQRQQQAIDALSAEQDNVRFAWHSALARRDPHGIAAAAEGLWLFSDLRGAYVEGEQLFSQAAAALGDADDALRGALVAAQGYFVARTQKLAEGRALMERALTLLRRSIPWDGRRMAFALVFTGFVARTQEQYDDAERLAEESLALFADCDDRWGVVYSLLLMGWVVEYRGRPSLACQLYRACLDRSHELGERLAAASAACGLARILILNGDYPQAALLIKAAIADADRLGDPLSLAAALHERGRLDIIEGRLEHAALSFEGSARAFARLGGAYAAGPGTADLALAGALRGDGVQLDRAIEMTLQAAQGQFERWHVARHLDLLGQLVAARSDAPRAAQLHRESLRLAEQLNHEPAIASAAGHLGALIAAHDGESAELLALLRRSVELAIRHQLAPLVLEAAVVMAGRLTQAGQVERALELLALVEHHPVTPASARANATTRRTQLHAAIGPAAAGEIVARGLRLNWRAVAQQLLMALADDTAPTRSPVVTNLSDQLPPLIGRDYELARLLSLLSTPGRRLVTLLGPGGIGKTRLAQEAGLALLDAFPDGVFFVSLVPISDPGQLAMAIIEQLKLSPGGAGEPGDQLLRYLREKQLLLVLDNFEHLLEGAELITAILQAAPKVVVLVTSRERLGLDDERIYTLGGIEVPEDEGDEQAMERGAVRLLLQHVRKLLPNFDPGPADLDAMIRVVRLVQGMPLAIILAASWAELLSLSEIAAEIERSLDFLEADLRALPLRQRSVRAVFIASWRRLQPDAQHAFARMTVFRGSFARRAAERVAGADLRALRTLVYSSFIALDSDDRCGIHELLRQFGAEQLAELGEADELLDRHSAYYLELLASWEDDLKGHQQLAAFGAFERDLDNIRQAWGRALERRDREHVGRALNVLFLLCEKLGRFREGAELLLQAREALAPETGELWQRLTARLAILRSLFPRERQLPLAEIERSRALAKATGSRADQALTSLALGHHFARTENDYGRAIGHYERAYELHLSLGDRFYQAEGLARLGICLGYLGDVEAFYQRCHEALTLAEMDGNGIGMTLALANMVEALLHLGRYDEAVRCGERQIKIAGPLRMRNSATATLASIALASLLEGDLARARALAVEGYRLSSELDNGICAGLTLSVLSLHAGLTGDHSLGLRFAQESLAQPLNLVAQVQTHWGAAVAQIGLGRHEEASRSLLAGLAAANRFASDAPKVWLLPVAAVLAAKSGDARRAAELLALAANHPLRGTGWMGHWRPLTDLRDDLGAALGTDTFGAALERGAQLDLAAALAGPAPRRDEQRD